MPLTRYLLISIVIAASTYAYLLAMSIYTAIQNVDNSCARVLKSIEQQANPLVFIGDSTAVEYSPHDLDTQSIAQMLQANLHTDVIDWPGVGSAVNKYSYLLEQHIGSSNNHITVVICLNLRLFNSNGVGIVQKHVMVSPLEQWLSKHGGRYGSLLASIVARQTGLGQKVALDDDAWAYLDKYGHPHWKPECEHEGLAKTYAFTLEPATNPQILNLKKCLEDSRHNHIKVIAYITPLNFSRLNELLSEAEKAQIYKNIEIIKEVCSQEQTPCLDLSQALPQKSYFFDYAEHLNAKGKRIVAQRLAIFLQNNP